VIGYNTYIDPSFPLSRRGQTYLFSLGLFPYVEFSGRLANYVIDEPPWYRPRDLSANMKVTLPRLFRVQPDIAFGRNDLGGGAPLFRSTYVAMSKDFDGLNITVGKASGKPYLTGLFGGVEVRFGRTGMSALVERNNGATHAGLRFASEPIPAMANAIVVGTIQRSFGVRDPGGGKFDRTAAGINLVMPFGENARSVRMPEPANDVVWTPPPAYRDAPSRQEPSRTAIRGRESATKSADARERTMQPHALDKLHAALENVGLERVRIGRDRDRLVIEYENHRYNRNEVDAIGIVLALAARLSPDDIARIVAVTKKAGMSMYATSVDRARYRRFLDDGDRYEALDGLEVTLRYADGGNIHWLGEEGGRGFSRVLLEPVLRTFVGTEYGVVDHSLALAVNGIAPLWKGAEAYVSYLQNLSDSDDVRNGPFHYARQRSGVRSALLNQSLWLTDRVLNLTSVGRFQYDYTGFQNETTYFVHGRDDMARLQYTRLRYADRFFRSTEVSIAASYRWVYHPLGLWIEAGYNQYVENDRGPSLRISRWFGDIEAQGYMRRSRDATFVGFRLAFPLTPRQGMKPGYTHVEGPGRYRYGLETKLASVGDCNCIADSRNIAVEIPIVYSADGFLLNQGRIGKGYIATQLPRMREAGLLYATFD